MRNSAIIFIFLGLIFISTLYFAFVYLPKMASANGISSKNLVLELPIDSTTLRYNDLGIQSFCLNRNNGIDFEVREKTAIMAPASGAITKIFTTSNRIVIQPTSSVFIYISPVTNLSVSEGDYVSVGDILGYAEGTNVHLTLDNQKNDRYECPYLFLSEKGKEVINKGLRESLNSSGRICECDNLKY